ncbi:MAG: tetratricopeptide repeat protein [Desulfobacteraceae bacterium]
MRPYICALAIILFSFGPVFAAGEKETFEKGVQQLKEKEYKQAVQTFTDLIDASGENANVYKNRGVAYMKMKKFDLAVKDFKKAEKLNPELEGVYSNLGTAFYYQKEYKKAISSYDREISLRPDNAVAYFNRALALAELEKLDQALEDLERTLERKPGFYWALCFQGDILARKGRTKSAVKSYKKAAALDTDSGYAQNQLDAMTGLSGDEDSKTYYTIQAGVFRKKSNAKHLNDKIAEMGYEANVLRERDGLYFVRTGRFHDAQTAKQAMEEFKRKTGMDAVIKQEGGVD